ncbi:MAG: hypothetical protein ABH884_02010 [Candidatus Komeilibacteria bacterium]
MSSGNIYKSILEQIGDCLDLVQEKKRQPRELSHLLQLFIANDDKFVIHAIKKLGGIEVMRKIATGELIVSEPERKWQEKDGIIYLTVTSDGTTGPQWIERLQKKGFRLSDYAKSLLISADFKPTTGVVYKMAILKGMLFNDRDRITKRIRSLAEEKGFSTPNAEVACLMRESLSDEELGAMGLILIITMHEPIKNSGDDLDLLLLRCDGDGHWLRAYCDYPDGQWYRGHGFAFVSSQMVF